MAHVKHSASLYRHFMVSTTKFVVEPVERSELLLDSRLLSPRVRRETTIYKYIKIIYLSLLTPFEKREKSSHSSHAFLTGVRSLTY